MNKTLKAILAASGALVLGGLGEGLGAELLKKVAKTDDTTEDAIEDTTVTAEEPEVIVKEVSEETETED